MIDSKKPDTPQEALANVKEQEEAQKRRMDVGENAVREALSNTLSKSVNSIGQSEN